ncbi:MAG: hypothetical protein QW812_01250 [Thermoplasmataceae archaeon]
MSNPIMRASPYVIVAKSSANREIAFLRKKGILDSRLKIRQEGGNLIIPVKKPPQENSETLEFEFKPSNLPPYRTISDICSQLKGNPWVPKKWVRVGNAVIVKVPSKGTLREDVASVMAEVLGASAVYEDFSVITARERIPVLNLVYGHAERVVHRENGIEFSLVPNESMFSPGNVNIRCDLQRDKSVGGIAMDLFAGIGYFTLHIARNPQVDRVYAVEINPISYKSLLMNIEKNHLRDKIIAVPGDCRSAFDGIMADYISMGHFDSPFYMPAAVSHCKTGTVVDFHVISGDKAAYQESNEIIRRAGRLGCIFSIISRRKVKSYSPHRWHVVVRAECIRRLGRDE